MQKFMNFSTGADSHRKRKDLPCVVALLLLYNCFGTNSITLKREFVISSLLRPFHPPMASACGIMIQVLSLTHKLETYFLGSVV